MVRVEYRNAGMAWSQTFLPTSVQTAFGQSQAAVAVLRAEEVRLAPGSLQTTAPIAAARLVDVKV
jgi:hypothetical protein